MELAADETIAPGQQKTFAFTVTASTTPSTYNFQWRMVHEGVEWFGELTPNVAVTVTVASPLTGDLDGDSKRTLTDVRLMIHMLIGQVPKDLTTADLTGDGQLTLTDLQALIRLLVGVP